MSDDKAVDGVYNLPNRPSDNAERAEEGVALEHLGSSARRGPHELPRVGIWVEETSGVAAAEATGQIGVEREEEPDETAGSG